MRATADPGQPRDERIMDDESGEDQPDHADEVDPVRDDEDRWMSFAIMCEMRHLLHPPRACDRLESLASGGLSYMHSASGARVE